MNDNNERPPKSPETISEMSYASTWEVAEACWPKDPAERLPVSVALERLQPAVSLSPHNVASPTDDIGAFISFISSAPVNVSGNFSDIFEGVHPTAGRVAIIRPRFSPTDDTAIRVRALHHDERSNSYVIGFSQRYEREARIWQSLQHPHILSFLGTFTRDGHLYLVTPFIDNGDIVEYINTFPHVNRIRPVGCLTSLV